MNVFIACSASQYIDKKYLELTLDVSKYLVEQDYNLVFGAFDKSMMGICYDEFKNNNKNVVSITPKVYEKDLERLEYGEKIVTDDTMMRFKNIYDLSDLIVLLPGGIGTLTEVLNAIEDYRTIPNDKRIVLYNFEGFYDDILNWFFDKKELGFISGDIKDLIDIVDDFEEFKSIVGGITWKK